MGHFKLSFAGKDCTVVVVNVVVDVSVVIVVIVVVVVVGLSGRFLGQRLTPPEQRRQGEHDGRAAPLRVPEKDASCEKSFPAKISNAPESCLILSG